jgi:hypothetical protein
MKDNMNYSSLFSPARVGGRLAEIVPARAVFFQLDGLPTIKKTEKDPGNIEFLMLDGGLYCFTMFEASRLAGFGSPKFASWLRLPKTQAALRAVSSPSLPLKISLHTLIYPNTTHHWNYHSRGSWYYTGRTLKVVSFEEAVLFWQYCADCLEEKGTTAKNLLIFLKQTNCSLYELADRAFSGCRDVLAHDYSDDVLNQLTALKDVVSKLNENYSYLANRLEIQSRLLDLQTERLLLSNLNQNEILFYFQFLLSVLTQLLNWEDNQQVKELTSKLSDIQSLHASTTARYSQIVDEFSRQISEMARCRHELTSKPVKQEWTESKLAELVGLDYNYVPRPDEPQTPNPLYKNLTSEF